MYLYVPEGESVYVPVRTGCVLDSPSRVARGELLASRVRTGQGGSTVVLVWVTKHQASSVWAECTGGTPGEREVWE
jgi:hypothetical protein